MKKSFLLPCFFFLTILSAQAATGPRQRMLIDAGWKFSQTDTIGALNENFNDSQWRVLNLPHDWSIENAFKQDAPTGGGGGYLPTGIGWYRKTINLSKAQVAKDVWIEFDGVYQRSDVWVNGQHLGHYPNGYNSFYYKLDKYLKPGKNVIAVRVDNSLQPNTRWYSGSGIYRHVWLTVAEPVHVAQWGTFVSTPKVDSASATVSIKVRLENTSGKRVSGALRFTILDSKGREVASKESALTFAANGTTEQEQQIQVSTPALWSVETPNMYSVRTQVLQGAKLVDEVVTPFGIRDIRYDVNKGFLLNGKQVKMKGVCLHHDAGSVGAAVPEAVWVRRLKTLREMGCNAIRTSHNPMAPEFLDLCDKMGFLVQDEVFDEWLGGKVKFGYNKYFEKWAQTDLVNFIHRDRNHPSVVMYSAGNEIGEQGSPTGHLVLKGLVETLHREDPTRPVTTGNDLIAADGRRATVAFLEGEDIVGYNYPDRWHERRELFYGIDRHEHPNWKMVGTEVSNVNGIRGRYFGRRDTTTIVPIDLPRLIQAEQQMKFVKMHDYVIGDFMWTGIDYLGESRWPNRNSSSGVIDLCGFPKDAYYFYQSQWTEKPMVHLAPHWNWKGREGTVIPVIAFTNCDSVELFVNGRSFGLKALEFPRQGTSGGWNRYARPQVGLTTGDLHLSWDVPYTPGTIRAVGRKNGKTYVQEIHTTSAPASIRLSADRGSINADGTDVSHLKFEVIDADGRVVPTANVPISLKIEGSGTLIGFDNGNPTEHVSMKSSTRNSFNGLALAIIQSNGEKGTIKVTATSPGMKETSFTIATK
ncbi:glycoside hydrolase family 2 TIM barrel-domain containing protein [Paradesertivirga mongoliensis]|uniref:Glycoside hydrolase family 2 TIM barrel-domain containing protein n=1 Tax=Paradesertivirga mongoliensis TaxID=2100740 RepID=A0ABW4ZRQ1_9SPHI|nr:glycoside hydrolase family 2 TIM barrel-domain containing protein [Pedobacter mongoliensis]